MTTEITRRMTLFFPTCECEKPIIYHLVKDHDLVVNVFRAKVTPEEEGYLTLDMTGTEKNIESALEFVKTFNVTVNEAGKGLTWDREKCVDCGVCLTHCHPGALYIKAPDTREVAFDAEKCIECLACVTVCPYKACASTY